MPDGASVDRGAAAALDVLRHMRRDAGKADVGHEIPGVVALVGCQRLLVCTRERTGHPQRRLPPAIAIRCCHLTSHHQAVAVLHQAMPQVAEERPGATGLAEQPGFPIAAGAVGLVGEQQAAEISLGTRLLLTCSSAESVAATGGSRLIITPVDPLQRAVGGPGPQQGAIQREVLAAQQRLNLRSSQKQLQKLGHELLVEQPVTVFGERRGMPDGIIRVESDKPAEQQV